MTEPIEILAGGLGEVSPFGPTSRYAGLTIAEATVEGVTHRYVSRRFVPDPELLATVGEHVVVDGDRPDIVAFRHLGDPELFWRLCDANRAVFPAELTATVGRRLRITLPEGIPGAVPDA